MSGSAPTNATPTTLKAGSYTECNGFKKVAQKQLGYCNRTYSIKRFSSGTNVSKGGSKEPIKH